MASNGVQNGKSHSDVGLIHRGDMVDCLLGVACRCWHSVRVPVTMRRVGLRSPQGARGSCRSWGSGGNHPTEDKGSKGRINLEGLTKCMTSCDKLITMKGT